MHTILLDGTTWAHELSPTGDLKFSWGGNGPEAASWGMALPPGFLHPSLTQGASVDIYAYGVCPVLHGHLEEPNRDTWQCTAVGTSDFLNNVANLAWDEGEEPDVGNTAYDGARYAIGATGVPDPPLGLVRGFDFSVDGSTPGGPEQPDVTPVPEYGLTLRAALEDFTTRTGKVWMVDEHGLIHVPDTPTEPTLALTPNVPGVGLTLENYYSATFLRYWDHSETVGSESVKVFNTVYAVSEDAWRWGPRERVLEHDPDVQISEANAQAVVDAMQAESVAAPTMGVELAEGQLTNLGGTPIALPLLKTNVMLRHFGVLDVPGARNVHEWVINHVEYDTTTGTATITPRHIAPRTMAQVVAAINAPPVPRLKSDSDRAA